MWAHILLHLLYMPLYLDMQVESLGSCVKFFPNLSHYRITKVVERGPQSEGPFSWSNVWRGCEGKYSDLEARCRYRPEPKYRWDHQSAVLPGAFSQSCRTSE